MPGTPSNWVNVSGGGLAPIVILRRPSVKVYQQLAIAYVVDGCHGDQGRILPVFSF